MKNKLKNHPLVDLMFEYGSMSLPTHRSSARNFSISSPSTSTSNKRKYQANIDGEQTEITFEGGKGDDEIIEDVKISWGDESHTLDFKYDDIGEDHDTEGSEATFIAKSKDGKWNFEMSVAVAYGFKSGQCNPCIQDYPIEIFKGIYLEISKDPDYEEQEEYDKGWYNEGENDEDEATFSVSYEEGTCGYGKNGKIGKKPAGPNMLQERFQKLAGIKPLYEQVKKPNLKSIDDIDRSTWNGEEGGSIEYMEWEDGTEMTPQEIQDYFEVNHELYDDIMNKVLDPKDPGSENGEIKISLEDLTFDQIVDTFTDNYQDVHFTRKQPDGTEGNYYRDSITFPNFDDSSTHIGDENAWEDWKSKTMRHYGNVTIVLKPDGKNWFDKVFIDDDKFNQNKDNFITGKMSAMQRDMDAGRSID